MKQRLPLSHLDKQTPDKKSALNFRPVSIIPAFPKIFKVIKNYLMKSINYYSSASSLSI